MPFPRFGADELARKWEPPITGGILQPPSPAVETNQAAEIAQMTSAARYFTEKSKERLVKCAVTESTTPAELATAQTEFKANVRATFVATKFMHHVVLDAEAKEAKLKETQSSSQK